MSALAERIQKTIGRSNASRIGPIGLDFSLSMLHLVQLQSDVAGVISMYANASVSFPEPRESLLADPKKIRSVIHQAIKAGGFHGKQVVTTLPSADTRIIPVSYQVGEGQSDSAALLKLLAERVDEDLSEYVIDYQPVRASESSKERLAIVALARREAVISYLEMLRKAGLDIQKLEIGPSAIRRLVSAIGTKDQHENVLVINFGRTASYITVLSGNRLMFDQEIRFGESGLLEKTARELDMTEEQVLGLLEKFSITPGLDSMQPGKDEINVSATLHEIIKPLLCTLIDEINRVLVYTASQTHGEAVSRVYLLGSLARWRGMDVLLNSLVKLPVETIPNPLQILSGETPEEGGSSPQPEVAVAMGLALSGFDTDG